MATRDAIQTPRHHTATRPNPHGDPRRDSDPPLVNSSSGSRATNTHRIRGNIKRTRTLVRRRLTHTDRRIGNVSRTRAAIV
jgi:hypothetical protein